MHCKFKFTNKEIFQFSWLNKEKSICESIKPRLQHTKKLYKQEADLHAHIALGFLLWAFFYDGMFIFTLSCLDLIPGIERIIIVVT